MTLMLARRIKALWRDWKNKFVQGAEELAGMPDFLAANPEETDEKICQTIERTALVLAQERLMPLGSLTKQYNVDALLAGLFTATTAREFNERLENGWIIGV